MATKKTKTTSDTNTDGTTTATSGTEIVTMNSNEGSTGAVTVAPDLTAGATSSQDPASATGEEQPEGTNTEGDDAGASGKTSVEPPIPEPVLTANEAAANPEAAAPASGTLSLDEQFIVDGMTALGFEHDGIALTREEVASVMAGALRAAVDARRPVTTEVRSFELLKGVILHNKIVDAEIVELTQAEHAMLVEQGAVFPDWDKDALEVNA